MTRSLTADPVMSGPVLPGRIGDHLPVTAGTPTWWTQSIPTLVQAARDADKPSALGSAAGELGASELEDEVRQRAPGARHPVGELARGRAGCGHAAECAPGGGRRWAAGWPAATRAVP